MNASAAASPWDEPRVRGLPFSPAEEEELRRVSYPYPYPCPYPYPLPLPLPLNLTNGTGLALGLAQLVLKVLYPSFEVRVRKDSPSDDDGASDTGSDAVLLASCA